MNAEQWARPTLLENRAFAFLLKCVAHGQSLQYQFDHQVALSKDRLYPFQF